MKDLVKNPIGIIALFISMIYGFANLLIGTTASTLTSEERYPLIIFIVLFPVVVLGVYYKLVAQHHRKLYAPGDFRSDDAFLGRLPPQEREERLNYEAAQFEAEAAQVYTAPTESPAQEEEAVPKAEGKAAPDAAPDTPSHPVSPHDSASRAYLPSDKVTSEPRTSREIRNEIRAVEQAVISKYERKLDLGAQRDVVLGGTGASFDAAFIRDGRPLMLLEVKSFRNPNAAPSTLSRFCLNLMLAQDFLQSMNAEVVLAAVCYFPEEALAGFERAVRRELDRLPIKVQLDLIPRAELPVD